MNTIHHIIWDWNGTLFDDAWLCVDILNQMLARYDLPAVTLTLYQEHFDFPVEKYYQKLGFDFDEKHSFHDISFQYMDIYNKRRYECNLHDHALEIVKFVTGLGISQSILSAYHQTNLQEIVDYFHINKIFSYIVGLDNYYAASKIDIGKTLINNLNIDGDGILLVGDTKHDYEVARALGIQCILIPGGHQKIERLMACDVPVVSSHNHIKEYLLHQKI